MRFSTSVKLAAIKGSLLASIALPCVLGTEVDVTGAVRRHAHVHQKKHENKSEVEDAEKLSKRGQPCSFPGSNNMVAVAANAMNGGWALPPDQPCYPGLWCPFACPPGHLMGQWDPDATAYTYPQSMNGGLLCGMDGEISVPFPDKPFCYEGHGTFIAQNQCSDSVAICQTVLPGREDMLIPTVVTSGDTETLAVPGTEYWCKTAAHYYVNPPGVSAADGCVWGSTANPYGNWAPYVAGANIDDSGNTFTKIGWNPIYLEEATPFRNQRPEFGLKIVCEEGQQCNGLPCIIDPAVDDVNAVNTGNGGQSSDGAGGGNFCVVTAPPGVKAILVTFPAGQSGNDESISADSVSSSSQSSASSSTVAAYSTTSSSSPLSTSTSTSSSLSSTSTSTSSSTSSSTSVSLSSSSTSISTSTSCTTSTASSSSIEVSSSTHYNTTSSAYTPTLTPVNQGLSNATADASLYTGAATTTQTLPTPSPAEASGKSAASTNLPQLSVILSIGLVSIISALLDV